MKTNRVRKTYLLISVIVGVLTLFLLTGALSGLPLQAAPLFQGGTGTDPAVEAITLTASANFPISDTRPYAGVSRTIYFNNDAAGAISLTFEISGTPTLTLTPGAAFSASPAAITSASAPWFPVVTYTVATTEGSYADVVYTVANSGYQTTTQVALTYTRDVTAPTVAITAPSAGYFTGTSLSIEGTSADNSGGSGVRSVRVSTDTTWFDANGTTSWDYVTSLPSADGDVYTVSAQAEDYLGSWGPVATQVITVDNSPPAGPPVFTPSLPVGQWVATSTLNIEWGGFSEGHGIAGYQYLVNGSDTVVLPGAGGQFTADSSASGTLAQGESYFHVAAQDLAGNWSDTYATGVFRVDTVAPTSTVTYAPQYENGTISVTWETGSSTSPISETCLLYMFGSAGSWTESGDCAPGGDGTFGFTPIDGEGTYYFQTVAEDVAGNSDGQGDAEGNTTYDVTPPLSFITEFPDSSGYTSTSQISMTWLASDSTSGVKETCLWVKWNDSDWSETTSCKPGTGGPFTHTFNQGDGTYFFRSQAEDNAGNVQPSVGAVWEIIYDTTPPTSTAIDAPTYDVTGTIPVTWTASDAASGVAETCLWYKLEDAGTWNPSANCDPGTSGTFDFDPLGVDGVYHFATVSEDELGNTESDPTGDGDVQTVYDTTAPTSTITSVPPYENGDIPVEWAAGDATSGLDRTCLWYKVESTGTWTQSTSCDTGTGDTFTFTPPGGVNGTYFFETVAQDNAGNGEDRPAGDSMHQTIYDTEGPTTVTIDAPEQIATTTFDISWNADDDLLDVVSFTVEYSETHYSDWQPFTTTSSLSDTFTAAYTDTTYVFRVTAYDQAGNSAMAEDETFIGQFRTYLPLVLSNYDPFVNGSFEQGFTGWERVSNPLPVSAVSAVQERPSGSTAPSDGERAVLLGNQSYPCSSTGVPMGHAAVEQTFVVPEDATDLTFDYIIWTQDASLSGDFDRFEVYINGDRVFEDGNQVNELGCSIWRRVPGPDNPRNGGNTSGWASKTISLIPYRGQSITLSFRNYSRYDHWYNTYTYVDNVRVTE
jgi:hypothetical protein